MSTRLQRFSSQPIALGINFISKSLMKKAGANKETTAEKYELEHKACPASEGYKLIII